MTEPDELERLARAATPGPWVHGGGYYNDHGGRYDQIEAAGDVISGEWGGPSGYDAAFIAAANPATILALLSERAELLATVERMREIIVTLLESSKPDCPAGITARIDARAALTTGEGTSHD